MAKLCTYVVREDTGLAPNPYWNYCTLAVCTPNHQGIRLDEGDWIAGVLTKARNHRLLYVMRVAESLDLDAYFHCDRFVKKKPNLKGSWQERCGDNFYSRGADGEWIRHRNRFHLTERLFRQDTKYARAFIGIRFSYFGMAAQRPPEEFASLFGGRGSRVNHNPVTQSAFIEWADRILPQGIHGLPCDNPDLAG